MNNYQRYFIFSLLFIIKIDFSLSVLYRMENDYLYVKELPRSEVAYVILPAYLYHRNAKIKFKIEARTWYSPGSSYASYKLSDKEYLSDSEAMDTNNRNKLTFKEELFDTLFDDIYINSSTNFVVIIYSGESSSIGNTSPKTTGYFTYSIEYTFPIERMGTSSSGSLSFSGEMEKSYFYEMKLEVGQIQLNVITKLLLENFFYLTTLYSYSEDQMLESKDFNYLSYKSEINEGIYNYSLKIINKDEDIKYLILKINVPIHSNLETITVNKIIVDIPNEPSDNNNNNSEKSSKNNEKDNSGDNKISEIFQLNKNNMIYIVIIIILLIIIIIMCFCMECKKKNSSKLSNSLIELNSNNNKNNLDLGIN